MLNDEDLIRCFIKELDGLLESRKRIAVFRGNKKTVLEKVPALTRVGQICKKKLGEVLYWQANWTSVYSVLHFRKQTSDRMKSSQWFLAELVIFKQNKPERRIVDFEIEVKETRATRFFLDSMIVIKPHKLDQLHQSAMKETKVENLQRKLGTIFICTKWV